MDTLKGKEIGREKYVAPQITAISDPKGELKHVGRGQYRKGNRAVLIEKRLLIFLFLGRTVAVTHEQLFFFFESFHFRTISIDHKLQRIRLREKTHLKFNFSSKEMLAHIDTTNMTLHYTYHLKIGSVALLRTI